MQNKTIDAALLALGKQITRENLDGICHVEAVLAMRGIHMTALLPAKRGDVAKRDHSVADGDGALKDGPKPLLDYESL